MAHGEYYPEEVLVEKVQAGEYGWFDYVKMCIRDRAGADRHQKP